MAGPEPDPPHAVFLAKMVLHPDPIVTTNDMLNAIDLSDQGVRDRFKTLQAAGLIEGKEVGSAAKVWWVTDLGRKYVGMADLELTMTSEPPQLRGIQ